MTNYDNISNRYGDNSAPIHSRDGGISTFAFVVGAAVVSATFGYSLPANSFAIGTATLAISCARLAVLDAETFVLPDRWTLPLGGGGLGFALAAGFDTAVLAIAGALLGGTLLASVATWHRHRRGTDGLGGGDIKLAGALGMWCGIESISVVIAVAALAALAVGLGRRLAGRPPWPWPNPHGDADAMPFGVFLCLTALPVWLLGRSPEWLFGQGLP